MDILCRNVLAKYRICYSGLKWEFTLPKLSQVLHGPSMFIVKAKIYGVLFNQSSSIAFDETSSYWSAPKAPNFSA